MLTFQNALSMGETESNNAKKQKNILDFSASVNPFPPKFEWHCNPELLAAYPDDSYHELKERIGAVFHRKPDEICGGNGSVELIRAFCSVALSRDKDFFVNRRHLANMHSLPVLQALHR